MPQAADLHFFGDEASEALFAAAVERLTALGGQPVAIDFAPFRETAELLYSGPWVAERMAAIEPFLRSHPDSIHPVTYAITTNADRYSAVDTFRAMYRLEELRRAASAVWEKIDVLLVPTAGTIYTVDQLEADPVALNSNLGTYTNFTNLLDLSAIAVPNGFGPLGLPLGRHFHSASIPRPRAGGTGRPLAAGHRAETGSDRAECPRPRPSARPRPASVSPWSAAIWKDMPLNGELLALGARKLAATRTEPIYRLYALPGFNPPRPGLLRVAEGEGHAIEAEVWEIPADRFGEFVVRIQSPLGIGTVQLQRIGPVKGFLCEHGDGRGRGYFALWRMARLCGGAVAKHDKVAARANTDLRNGVR